MNNAAEAQPNLSENSSVNAQTRKLQVAIDCGVPISTQRNRVLGQLIFCEGCCCGRTDRGFPAWPRDFIKSRWKEHKLNTSIQLTISGCLGPCDVANVVCMMPASGPAIWLGGISELTRYTELVDWAIACQRERRLLDLPSSLMPHRFVRFALSGTSSTSEKSAEETAPRGPAPIRNT
jgi:hypothetical protein